MGQFSTLPYLGMKLGHWPKSQKLHTYYIFLPGSLNSANIRSMGSTFRDTALFSITIFGHKTWQVAKVPEVAHIPSFYSKGLNFSLFLLYGQWFSTYRPIFKIAIFGHETWQVPKVPVVAHILSFYPQELIELIHHLNSVSKHNSCRGAEPHNNSTSRE